MYQSSAHRVGLMSMMDATVLVSMLNKLEIVDACGREMLPPGVRDCEEMPPPIDRKESQNGGGRGGIPCAMAGLLATRNDINVALDDQRPPHDPRICRIVMRVIERSRRTTTRPCGRNLPTTGKIPEGGSTVDFSMREHLSWYSNPLTTASTPSTSSTGRQMGLDCPLRRSRDL